ncbi:MAG: ParB/RepB/Spo0J family partition protein [Clostridia bacterium]|nr:ParB/RepB/Spo0J family partition protein [Clostridia bacterium]
MEFKTKLKSSRIIQVPISSIKPNSAQPRKYFDKAEIEKLAESIKQVGIISPLLIRKRDNKATFSIAGEMLTPEQYELIAGERRLRAAKKAGLKKVPCIVSKTDDNGSAVIALTENLQRRDLNFFEEAYAMQRLMFMTESTQSELAQTLGISQSAVANKVRLLKFSAEEKEEIIRGGLSERQARALLRIDSKGDRIFMIKRIGERQLNALETEKAVAEFLKHKAENEKTGSRRVVGTVDVRFFVNSIDNAVSLIRKAGINVGSTRRENSDSIEISLIIPKTGVKIIEENL